MPSNIVLLLHKRLPLLVVSSGEDLGAFPELAVLFLPTGISSHVVYSLCVGVVYPWQRVALEITHTIFRAPSLVPVLHSWYPNFPFYCSCIQVSLYSKLLSRPLIAQGLLVAATQESYI